MSCEFSVSVKSGGDVRLFAAETSVVVPAAFPYNSDGNSVPGSSKLYVIFAADQVHQAQCQAEILAADDAVSASGFILSRQTLVMQGDAGFCSSGCLDTCDGIFSSLKKVEEASASLAAAAREEWQAARSAPQPVPTDGGPPAAFLGAPSGQGVSNKSIESNPVGVQPLEALGPSRAAYARQVCSALCRHCRWPTPTCVHEERSSCGVCTLQFACNVSSIVSPSAAFSLVYHSEAFGLLFFCRDKLGLAPLLAMEPSTQHEGGLCLALATSAARLRIKGVTNNDRKGGTGRVTEVGVDGVWLIDLWGMANLNNFYFSASDDREKNFEAAGSSPEQIFLGMQNAFFIPWEHPSIIRGKHIWCSCENCDNARTLFWRQHPFHGFDASLAEFNLLPSALLGLDGSRLPFNGKSGGELKDGSPVTSAQVLSCLYRHLNAAVLCAIPEALRHIQNNAEPLENCKTAEPVFVGILFSGGVDSTLLAGIVLRSLADAMMQVSGVHTPDRNPAKCCDKRTLAAPDEFTCSKDSYQLPEAAKTAKNTPALRGTVVVELVSVCFSAEAPDRLTALRSFEDLLHLLHCLGKHYQESCLADANEEEKPERSSFVVFGGWALELRLVAVDVSAAESADFRSCLLEAIRPKKSHMDFNIAAPLLFASRGVGYLISPSFSRREEWQLLRQNASVWRELLIRPPSRPRLLPSQPPVDRIKISSEASSARGFPGIEKNQSAANPQGETKEERGGGGGDKAAAAAPCRVCRRQAKEACVHSACKLCCEKLRAVAARGARDPKSSACDSIYVGGQGMISISVIGVAVCATCPVHRRNLLGLKTQHGNEEGKENEKENEKEKEKQNCHKKVSSKTAPRPAPFESLTQLPCGVPLATNEAGRPFMAMRPEELRRWSAGGQNHRACGGVQTDSYTVKSRVLLMGSGADELFGGYGRHRTANVTRGWEALRKEQIFDLERLWIRNMGRDARALGAFHRFARFPFLDESLLRFVCCFVPFEQIVQPGGDLAAHVEAMLQRLLKETTGHMQTKLECIASCAKPAAGQSEDNNEKGEEREEMKRQEKTNEERDTACKPICMGKEEVVNLCSGNKWLLRVCAAFCGLPFCAIAKKRAMQFGSRSAKTSNSECFPSNRKSRGEAALNYDDEMP